MLFAIFHLWTLTDYLSDIPVTLKKCWRKLFSNIFLSLLTNSPSETKNEKTQTNSPNDRIINPTPFTLIWI